MKITKKQTKELNNIINKKDYLPDLDIIYHLEYNDFDTMEQIMEYLQDRIYEQDIIYYSSAMEFLVKHDASLQESTELAHDLGYTCKDINSELLATLLFQNFLTEELSEIESEMAKILKLN